MQRTASGYTLRRVTEPRVVVTPPSTVKVSVIIPVYNGAPYLETCLEKVRSHLIASGYAWEILVAEDGSTDGTKELCRKLRAQYPDVDFTNEDRRLGRGASLERSLMAATGDVMVYCDVDMATDPSHLDDLVSAILGGYDIVTGSRYLPESAVQRTPSRLIASRAYNALVRRLLGSKLSDHQCGFKAFKRDTVLGILPDVESRHWFWDTEVLVRAQHEGLLIAEIPVRWHESRNGKTTVRLVSDTVKFLEEVARLRRDLRQA